jgi:3-phenylpropionate/trans-cinnamate dioxygenase ferredoxin component
MFTPICEVSELQEGELYRFDIGDKPLLVVRFDVSIVVADSICTHEEADLSLGMFSDGTVTCPLHRAKFKLEDGSVISGPDGGDPSEIKSLKLYQTRVEDGKLFADL